jgi:hypothetical protein
MTYCGGILVREGLVMFADTRTNASHAARNSRTAPGRSANFSAAFTQN